MVACEQSSDVHPAALLLASLWDRGFTLWVEERPEGLVPRLAPATALTGADRESIRLYRSELIAALLEEARERAMERERQSTHPRTRFRWPDDPPEVADCGSWNWTCDELMQS